MALFPRENQLWLGNVPSKLNEGAALDELEAYSVRPFKLILRQGKGGGWDQYGIAYFSSTALRMQAQRRLLEARWSSKAIILARPLMELSR